MEIQQSLGLEACAVRQKFYHLLAAENFVKLFAYHIFCDPGKFAELVVKYRDPAAFLTIYHHSVIDGVDEGKEILVCFVHPLIEAVCLLRHGDHPFHIFAEIFFHDFQGPAQISPDFCDGLSRNYPGPDIVDRAESWRHKTRFAHA